ncbi:M14 metallopeptidase family protein [Winogradskyella litorisediminis]|uniref:M14 metallopeptidase family protein n=1 Tax=Winogradskyella litorisediminis TaxID=1156618 RepID=A0ABW3N447_9FLAO
MNSTHLKSLYNSYKETSLFGRYISPNHVSPLIEKMSAFFEVSVIGYSVNNLPIHSIKVGHGKTKVLLWSQMHGNESTTTKALFDMLNIFKSNQSPFNSILDSYTLLIIPMLNPDGAKAYTRLNPNNIDLNRDAQNLSQPESKVLRKCFETFEPDFCFNLHGQRTIFGAGNTGNVATLSFLSPSADAERSITTARIDAMKVISYINKNMQSELPDAIGRYDDGFNINCVGDTFQNFGIPTVLYEAGHYANDYDREAVRYFTFCALYHGLNSISKLDAIVYEDYFLIPENEKNFYDVIIRNVKLSADSVKSVDVVIQYKETLENSEVKFIPIVEKIEKLDGYFGHKIIEGNQQVITDEVGQSLELGNEIVFVMLNYRKILLKS